MFTFENADLSSNSIKEEGVLIIPHGIEDLHPLFVPKNRAVPFFLDFNGSVASDYFDNDELGSIFTNSPNILNLWKELEDADVVFRDCYSWTLLDTNSNILLNVSQVDGYYQNMLEVKNEDKSVFNEVIQIAYEQDIILSKVMYDKYMELNSLSKEELFQELKNLGVPSSYTEKVNKVLN
jgi:hypothetical protein